MKDAGPQSRRAHQLHHVMGHQCKNTPVDIPVTAGGDRSDIFVYILDIHLLVLL